MYHHNLERIAGCSRTPLADIHCTSEHLDPGSRRRWGIVSDQVRPAQHTLEVSSGIAPADIYLDHDCRPSSRTKLAQKYFLPAQVYLRWLGALFGKLRKSNGIGYEVVKEIWRTLVYAVLILTSQSRTDSSCCVELGE